MTTVSITEVCHRILREEIREGDVAVDATAGNGQDTLFLADAVGEGGCVYACDIQSDAVAATRRLLEKHGVSGRVELIQSCHANLKELVPMKWHGSVRAIVFNLGYLPAGDKTITTETGKTLSAIQQALDLLMPFGHLCVVAYPGHGEGASEADAVSAWAASLPASHAHSAEYRMINRGKAAPYLVHVQKSGR